MWPMKPDIIKLKRLRDVKRLVHALADRRPDIRQNAKKALADLSWEISQDSADCAKLIESLSISKRRAGEAVADVITTQIEYFRESVILSLAASTSSVRWRCAEILGRARCAEAVDGLTKVALSENDGDVQEAALWALDNIDTAEAKVGLELCSKQYALRQNRSLSGAALGDGDATRTFKSINVHHCTNCDKQLLRLSGGFVCGDAESMMARVDARATFCNRCSRLFCLACAFEAGKELGLQHHACPTCGGKVPDTISNRLLDSA